ncbi:MAG: hypothetical protein ACI9TF_000687 [Paracrocinitomix sp.]|jgi:hypothetical protein
MADPRPGLEIVGPAGVTGRDDFLHDGFELARFILTHSTKQPLDTHQHVFDQMIESPCVSRRLVIFER